ncbi:mitochondrial Homoaconitase [Taxawa tesnikishii (nom. ined.)]|nr:mitochondrial Homoaconitase [Dothideales sp. JES 119]
MPQAFTRILPHQHHRPRYYSATSALRLAQPDAFHAQLSSPSTADFLAREPKPSSVPQTLTEKIVQRHSLGLAEDKFVKSGDYVTLSPHHCMTHDNSWPVATKFMSIGATKIHDNRQIVMTLDHDVQNKSEKNLQKYRQIEEFAKKQGVDFYPAGRGIGHQIMVEEGYAWPGTLAVASDSHSNMYGGIGCLGTPVVRTDAASIWATGRTWWQIPPIAKVTFQGVLPKGVTGKDVIVALAGLFNKDEVLNYAIEFAGSPETLRSLSVDDRLAIANMTTEWGALSGLFPIDQVLQGWLRYKATEASMYKSASLTSSATSNRFNHERLDELFENPLAADPGAKYAKELFLDLATLAPYVSGPNSVKVATPLAELQEQNIKINKAYLVSCTNSRRSDIAAAAKVFKEAAEKNDGAVPKIPDHVDFYIAAASSVEQQAAEEQGDWGTLIEAGAKTLPAGCGPCIGLGTGLLEPGEVGISASNRNFKGRMGSTEAKAYLASPEVVAASALQGKIAGTGWYERPADWAGVVRGEGDGIKEEERLITIEEALERIINDAENMIEAGERAVGQDGAMSSGQVDDVSVQAEEKLTEILPGFPEKVSGEIVWCNGDNVNTDGIYPGKYTYDDAFSSSPERMATVVMENFDKKFASIAKAGDILVSGFNFGCGSSREQAATAILAKGIPSSSPGAKLVQRLRETFDNDSAPATGKAGKADITEPAENRQSLDTPPPAPMAKDEKVLTRRTGWTFTWDVRRSSVTIREGEGGVSWSQKVGELPPNVQDIIARGGLEKWVAKEIAAESKL